MIYTPIICWNQEPKIRIRAAAIANPRKMYANMGDLRILDSYSKATPLDFIVKLTMIGYPKTIDWLKENIVEAVWSYRSVL